MTEKITITGDFEDRSAARSITDGFEELVLSLWDDERPDGIEDTHSTKIQIEVTIEDSQ